METQYLALAMSPPQGESLSRYIDEVITLLGVGSDAGLARLMDIPASSVANWMRRGVVSKGAVDWFQEDLLAILARKDRVSFVIGTTYLNGVVEFLRLTECDPFNAGEDANAITGDALPAFLSLARIIMRGALGQELHILSDAECSKRLADLLREAAPRIHRALRGTALGPQ